ncbi:SgcJ/EcaC family oxidoreductase [Phenylobacterium sp.]|uniref:SgcJ/EcaC family oxidoreductase n=1 Tax=Phenylobacterium sp. TaxID=1871053 RepID=UPI0025D99035|nr:SgcJ/EcaC family oxidoreductase [Phenylobacterium sp.]
MKSMLIAALAWAAAGAGAAMAAPPSPADVKALRALGDAADAAWDARDADRMASYYAADASLLVGGGGPVQLGRDDIRAYFTRAFAQRVGTMRHVSEFRGQDMLGPDLVLTDLWVRVEERQPDGTWKEVRRFNNISLAVREDGAWKMKAVRAYPVG